MNFFKGLVAARYFDLNKSVLHKKKKRGQIMDKRIFKKSQEELEQYLQFKRRGSIVKSKKGKGSFKRNSKHKNRPDYMVWVA